MDGPNGGAVTRHDTRQPPSPVDPVSIHTHNTCREERYPGIERITQAAKATGMTAARVSGYCRHARNRDREAKVLHKFTEVAWKLGIHLVLTCWGTYVCLYSGWMYGKRAAVRIGDAIGHGSTAEGGRKRRQHTRIQSIHPSIPSLSHTHTYVL